MSESAFYARFPYSDGHEVVVAGKFPLTEGEWQHFIDAITALRPAFTPSLARGVRVPARVDPQVEAMLADPATYFAEVRAGRSGIPTEPAGEQR